MKANRELPPELYRRATEIGSIVTTLYQRPGEPAEDFQLRAAAQVEAAVIELIRAVWRSAQ